MKLATTQIIVPYLAATLASCGEKSINIGLNTQSQPNVILIYADDLGKGMLSVYGQQYVATPNIDRLFNSGVSFANSYGCMLSAPARASLLTGYHDCNTQRWRISRGGKYINQNIADTTHIAVAERAVDNSDTVLGEGDLYMAEVFKKAGYTTAQIGKLEYGFTATRTQMHRHGWDYWYGYLDHVRCHGFYPPFLFENDNIVAIEGNTRPNCGKSKEPETEAAYAERHDMSGKQTYSQDLFDQKIVEFITTHRDQPFFLYHPTQLPHGPVATPTVYPEIEAQADLTPIEKEYASMVKRLDETVGLIMDQIEKLNIAERTMVIFASDNGHEIYYSQKGRCEKPYRNMESGGLFDDYNDKYYSSLAGDRFDGNMGMAGLKRSNLDGGAHVPLAIYQKGSIDSGRESQQLVAVYDLLPTFAAMLGVDAGQKDGRSLLNELTGTPSSITKRQVVMSSYIGPSIVDSDGWKLRYYAPAKKWELYDLNYDRQERHNMADERPEKVEELKDILLRECGNNLNNGIYRD